MEKELTKEEIEKSQEFKNLGNEQFKNKEYIKAIESYTKAIEINPTEATFYSNRANAYQQLRKFKECIEDCNQALKYDPKFVKAMRRRGIAQQQLGQFKDALMQLEKARVQSPTDKTLKEDIQQTKEIILLYEKTEEALKAEKYSDAQLFIGRLVQKVPYWQNVHMLHIESTAKMGSTDRAQQLLQQYKGSWNDPQGPDVYYLSGLIQLYNGKSEQAKKFFTAGMQRDPDNKKCMLALKKTRKCESLKDEGNACLKEGDYDGALAKYDEAIELDPHNRQLNAVIHANKASVLLQQEKYKEAIKECDRSMELNENYPKSYFRRAEAFMKTEEFERAIHDYKKFQELDPSQNMAQQLKKAKLELKKSKQKDYYKILEVPKTAGPTEIKKSYKKLALKYHPDRIKDPSQKEEAEKKFKDINEAFQVLSDPKKKEMVDQGIDPNDQTGGGGGGMDPNDIFRSFFGGGGGGGGFPGGFGGMGGGMGGGSQGFTFHFG